MVGRDLRSYSMFSLCLSLSLSLSLSMVWRHQKKIVFTYALHICLPLPLSSYLSLSCLFLPLSLPVIHSCFRFLPFPQNLTADMATKSKANVHAILLGPADLLPGWTACRRQHWPNRLHGTPLGARRPRGGMPEPQHRLTGLSIQHTIITRV